jgi:hypothetical protein
MTGALAPFSYLVLDKSESDEDKESFFVIFCRTQTAAVVASGLSRSPPTGYPRRGRTAPTRPRASLAFRRKSTGRRSRVVGPGAAATTPPATTSTTTLRRTATATAAAAKQTHSRDTRTSGT